jgi:predicted  nucleic acid-binding Zn-ribbon protein
MIGVQFVVFMCILLIVSLSLLDASKDRLPIEPPTPTRTTEVLRQDLQTVNEELAELKKKWQAEKKQLANEKAALQDAANRLNAQVKEEARRLAETERIGEKKRMTVENVSTCINYS